MGLQYDDIRMPFWRSDNDDIVLNIKDEFVNAVSELVKDSEYVIDTAFERAIV